VVAGGFCRAASGREAAPPGTVTATGNGFRGGGVGGKAEMERVVEGRGVAFTRGVGIGKGVTGG
jgi:hypothetical protein